MWIRSSTLLFLCVCLLTPVVAQADMHRADFAYSRIFLKESDLEGDGYSVAWPLWADFSELFEARDKNPAPGAKRTTGGRKGSSRLNLVLMYGRFPGTEEDHSNGTEHHVELRPYLFGIRHTLHTREAPYVQLIGGPVSAAKLESERYRTHGMFVLGVGVQPRLFGAVRLRIGADVTYRTTGDIGWAVVFGPVVNWWKDYQHPHPGP